MVISIENPSSIKGKHNIGQYCRKPLNYKRSQRIEDDTGETEDDKLINCKISLIFFP
jgi:hypothetical protein